MFSESLLFWICGISQKIKIQLLFVNNCMHLVGLESCGVGLILIVH